MNAYAEQLLNDTAEDFSPDARRRLFTELDHNAPLREDVLTLLAQFKANLGPFFLQALHDRLDGHIDSDDPLRDAVRITFAIPTAEICDALLREDHLAGE